jgi:hypothetical protein
MPMTLSARRFVSAGAITMLFACGGTVESSDHAPGGEAGSTVEGSGGVEGSRGGTTGNGGAIGLGGATKSVGGCCSARTPNCDDGYVEIPSPYDCPSGSTCYTEAPWCCDGPRHCASIAIGSGGASAGGATGSAATGNVGAATAAGGACPEPPPVCDAGDIETTDACTLSTTTACYGNWAYQCAPRVAWITCLKPSVVCGRPADYNRQYHYADTTICERYDVLCATSTQRFNNSCGCGCEQPATCPQLVDCMPGAGTLDALCTDTMSCPFTARAM